MSGMAIPAVPYITLSDDGHHFLSGSRCEHCGQIFLGNRKVCAACFSRDTLRPVKLASLGRVYTFTTVCRSFPGVKVPFVMAVVDLDDGATVRGTLADADPAEINFDMRVKVVFRESGQTDSQGKPFIVFSFIPDK